MITDEATDEAVVPRYPVLEYGHVASGGDAIGSGFVYNGKLIPALRGKYLFTDTSWTPNTRTCCPPTTAFPRRWPRCTR